MSCYDLHQVGRLVGLPPAAELERYTATEHLSFRSAVEYPVGDTISSAKVFDAIDEHLASLTSAPLIVRFDIGAESLLERDAAIEWVNEARREGCDLVRYIIRTQPSGDVVIDLAAIESLHSDIEPPAV